MKQDDFSFLRAYIPWLKAYFCTLRSENWEDSLIHAMSHKVLDELEELLADDLNCSDCDKSLKKYLKNHWEYTKGTVLSYLAIPDARIISLLCRLAETLADEENTAISLLMPDLATESYSDHYPNLDQIKLQEVLITHVSGQESCYLVPVQELIAKEDACLGINRYNPYFDYEKHGAHLTCLTEEEWRRLGKHSTFSEAVISTWETYQRLLKEQNNLLSELEILCFQLQWNSAHGGIGSQEAAASGAYFPITHFFEYYKKLDKEEIERIPEALRTEIELLEKVGSDSETNGKETANLQTCIGTRCEQLVATKKTHEALLASIGLSEKTRAELIENSRQSYLAAREAMKNAILEKKYAGKDTLGLSFKLLDWLKVNFPMQSIEHVQLLMQCSETDIQCLLETNSDLPEKLTEQFDTLETLVVFSHELSKEKLEIFLTYFGKIISDKHIKNSSDFRAFILSMLPEKRQVIFKKIKLYLIENILRSRDAKDIANIIVYLNETDQRDFIQSIENVLFEVFIDKLKRLSIIKESIHNDYCHDFHEHFKKEILEKIRNSDDIQHGLYKLTLIQQRELIESIKGNLFNGFLKTGLDLKTVMDWMHEELREDFYIAYKQEILNNIQGVKDFQETIEYLAINHRNEIFESKKNELVKITCNMSEFLMIMNSNLDEPQKLEMYYQFEPHFLSLIEANINASMPIKFSFCRLTPFRTRNQGRFPKEIFNEERVGNLFHTIKHLFPNIIHSPSSFKEAIIFFGKRNHFELITVLGDNIPKVNECYKFEELIGLLETESRLLLFKAYAGHFDNFDNLSRCLLLSKVHQEERQILIDSLDFNKLFVGCASISYIFTVISFEEAKIILEKTSDTIKKVFLKEEPMTTLVCLRNINIDKYPILLNEIKEILPDLIENLTKEVVEIVIGKEKYTNMMRLLEEKPSFRM